MAKVNLNIIKEWFKTGLKPTQEQFWSWMDSFWHKDEKIPINQIDGIENIYTSINGLISRNPLIIPNGQVQIYKAFTNENNAVLEVGDFVVGLIENQFVQADYLGGDPMLLTSYSTVDPPPPPPPPFEEI